MTQENDIVLIYYEGDPISFARVESILPDAKKGWFIVKLLLLQIPLNVVTWILRDIYIDGDEFTMGGKKMRIERVECPKDEDIPQEPASQQNDSDNSTDKAKVISLKEHFIKK